VNLEAKKKQIFIIGLIGISVFAVFDYVYVYTKFHLVLGEEEVLRLSDDGSSVVILPTFTDSAYVKGGFYDYYKKICDESCLNIPSSSKYQAKYHSSKNAAHILEFLNYTTITDHELNASPNILKNYSKVILLHNEYVTQSEFDAITSHQKVIYLYPNGLYAKIEYNNQTKTQKLISGHNYPSIDIVNGFGWPYDITPKEYEDCKTIHFNKLYNGWQLTCNPEYQIIRSNELLKKIKEF